MAKNPHAVALGKRGGLVKSDRKATAARENGKKGGAPKKPRKQETPAVPDDPTLPRGTESPS
jgi:hypothetical protein